MGNCLIRPAGVSCEEAKPLVVSTLHDQGGDNCCKKRKKVSFNVHSDNAMEAATETAIMRPARIKKGVKVKVVLTQAELKQILNRATIYHDHHPPPAPSFIDQISGQVVVKCGRNRRYPALHTIPE